MGTSRYLRDEKGIRANLSYYGPGERMTDHAHSVLQLSFILSGHLIERSHEGDFVIPSGSVCIKPHGFEHDDEVGANGCLILTLNYSDSVPHAGYTLDTQSRETEGHKALWDRAHAFAFGRAPHNKSLAGLPPLGGISAPPASGIDSMTELETGRSRDLARAAGVHPVHYARVFRKRLGQSPQNFRNSERVAAAVQDIAFGALPFVEVAYKHGFSDQAHMTRSIKKSCGLTPSLLRTTFAAA
jgi:AraC family transcriptional regulator